MDGSDCTALSNLRQVLMIGAAMLMPAGLAAAQTTSPSEAKGTQQEEIVITAQKREENLQDVPISVSVLGVEALEDPSIQGLRDAMRTVPGLAVREESQTGAAKIAVRGVVSNVSLFNGGPTVGFYLDEIPFAFVRLPITPDANAYDLSRVEVLRGPQGTLYGANSLNGVVRVITEDADLDAFDARGRAIYSSTEEAGPNYRGDAAVNIPLVPGRLAVRAVAGYSETAGWIDAPIAGLADFNDGEQGNLRLKVNAAPTESFGVEFLSWFSRLDRGATSQSTESSTRAAVIPEPGSQEFDAYGLTLTYEFPVFTAFSSTSRLVYEAVSHNNSPSVADFLVTLGSELWAQEFRVSSNGDGPWLWSAGAIYRDVEDTRVQDDLRNAAISGVVNQEYGSQSYAVFGELTRRLTERLSLTAGLRHFEDEVTTTEISGPSITDVPFGTRTETFTALTPRVVLTFQPSDAATLYASYSEGFRSGFTQDAIILRVTRGFAPSVEPDRLRNYELGARGRSFDGRLNYDFALYYMDWRDTIQSIPFNFGTPAVPVITNGGVNSESAQGLGVDLGLTLDVTDQFAVGGTASWNDLQFAADVVGASGVVFPEGARPQESPEWTGGVFAEYSVPLANDFEARFGVSANYTSAMANPGPTGVLQTGDDLTYARASVSFTAPSGWRLTLFGDNLTDENGAIRPAPSGAAGEADRFRPRTIGIQLDVDF